MDAANLHKSTPMTGPGELVLQNGRQAGARRPLCVPTTFIGRNADCDIRLNIDGVDPMHCVLIVTSNGIHLRDLGSPDGTFVNDQRVEHVTLANGDVLKVGPFQFRVELVTPVSGFDDAPVEEIRSALRVQASAVMAQQAGLEEEEMRMQQRRADLQQQEEQLAAHLAERQREVQVWSDYTNTEREALRKEKVDQEKELDRIEHELREARTDLEKDQQKLTQERQRINKVYQRLRVRWQKQWSGEREKYENLAKKLQADAVALDERRAAFTAQEKALKQELRQFSADRELAVRQLQDARTTLRSDQDRWHRRRSQEFAVLKGIERRADEAQLKLRQARQLLVVEKENWEKQLDVLQKELHGLNNRIVHQRLSVQARTEEISRLDAELGERRLQIAEPLLAIPVPGDNAKIAVAQTAAPSELTPTDEWQGRFDALDALAGELADQRVHLVEQYKRLAEIQDAWQHQRDHAADELESVAQRLLQQQQAIDQREEQMVAGEGMLQQRLHEADAVRQDLLVWRAQLKARDQTFATEHEKQRLAVAQKDAQLQEQLAELEHLRARWQDRRQQEIEQWRERRASIEKEIQETQSRRVALFEKGQQLDQEKSILAEKTLALEQYRQDVLFRANDPAAQRRIERLRLRWLTLNAAVIRDAKAERDAARKELKALESLRAEVANAADHVAQSEAAVIDKQELLEEREAVLQARQLRLNEQIAKLEGERQQAQQQHLRLQDEIDAFAQAVYENPDAPPSVDQAA